MIARRTLLIAAGAGVLAPLRSFAQQPPKVARIGFLGAVSAAGYASRVDALRAGLRDLGYHEGKNLAIEFRWADGKYERLPDLAAELVRLKVDVIVTHAGAGTLAAKQATTTIPIVMVNVGDPVALGIIPSLARQGGNITGLTFVSPELTVKRLELLKEALPRIGQVAVLMNPDNLAANDPVMRALGDAAGSLKVTLQLFEARAPEGFESIFAAMARKRVDAILFLQDTVLTANRRTLAELAAKHRLPSAGSTDYGEAGSLLGYGVNVGEQFRRVGYFVDRILKGSKPADLPIERPTKYELVINQKTAKALGVTIPKSILVRADKVIE